MSLGLLKHRLDFEILNTGNPKTFIFLDSSEYFEDPDRPLLEVTMPGYTKYVLVNVVASSVNTFNSNTLGLTDILESTNPIDLPDGIWTLKFKVCPYDKLYIQKYHLRTVKLENNIQRIFDYMDLSDCDVEQTDKYRLSLVDVFILINSASLNASNGNLKKAYDQYQKANSLVSKLIDKLSGAC